MQKKILYFCYAAYAGSCGLDGPCGSFDCGLEWDDEEKQSAQSFACDAFNYFLDNLEGAQQSYFFDNIESFVEKVKRELWDLLIDFALCCNTPVLFFFWRL